MADHSDPREALAAALPVLRHYASSNPKQFYRGAWQDPNGVHAALEAAERALAQECPKCHFSCNTKAEGPRNG